MEAYDKRAYADKFGSMWGSPPEWRAQRVRDLNALNIDNADGPDVPISNASPNYEGTDIDVVFNDLEGRLAEEIIRWPIVVGCMAWLTNERVLAAMQTCQMVSIIVQKEDFLRPDSGGADKESLRRLYFALRGIDRFYFDVAYNTLSDPETAPIMCAGLASASQRVVTPRMHHKFLVFGQLEGKPSPYIPGETYEVFQPHAVWTGSFNATHNGAKSRENAVLIRRQDIAEAYTREWGAILGIAEALDWKSQWVAPEYRIGT